MEIYNFYIDKEDIDSRIDTYLVTKISDKSRSFFQKLITENQILVNEQNIKSNYKLKLGDRIQVTIPAAKPLEVAAENIILDILYEDNDIIVINKPQDMVVHPACGNYSGTLVNALLYHCKDNLSGINGIMRPGIVHRIDKDTSGVLVITKNDVAHQKLAEQFKNHTIIRKYHAIVFNNIKEDDETVDAPIGRHPVDRKKRFVTEKNSKKAITHFKVLERFGNFTYIEATLETGRTHQIRVHMSYIKHPLLGDTVYGPQNQPFKLIGQALHAKVLGFIHPTKNEYMEFESELPEYFKELLEKLRKNY